MGRWVTTPTDVCPCPHRGQRSCCWCSERRPEMPLDTQCGTEWPPGPQQRILQPQISVVPRPGPAPSATSSRVTDGQRSSSTPKGRAVSAHLQAGEPVVERAGPCPLLWTRTQGPGHLALPSGRSGAGQHRLGVGRGHSHPDPRLPHCQSGSRQRASARKLMKKQFCCLWNHPLCQFPGCL